MCVKRGGRDRETEYYSLRNVGNFNTEESLTEAILVGQLFVMKYLQRKLNSTTPINFQPDGFDGCWHLLYLPCLSVTSVNQLLSISTLSSTHHFSYLSIYLPSPSLPLSLLIFYLPLPLPLSPSLPHSFPLYLPTYLSFTLNHLKIRCFSPKFLRIHSLRINIVSHKTHSTTVVSNKVDYTGKIVPNIQ